MEASFTNNVKKRKPIYGPGKSSSLQANNDKGLELRRYRSRMILVCGYSQHSTVQHKKIGEYYDPGIFKMTISSLHFRSHGKTPRFRQPTTHEKTHSTLPTPKATKQGFASLFTRRWNNLIGHTRLTCQISLAYTLSCLTDRYIFTTSTTQRMQRKLAKVYRFSSQDYPQICARSTLLRVISTYITNHGEDLTHQKPMPKNQKNY